MFAAVKTILCQVMKYFYGLTLSRKKIETIVLNDNSDTTVAKGLIKLCDTDIKNVAEFKYL